MNIKKLLFMGVILMGPLFLSCEPEALPQADLETTSENFQPIADTGGESNEEEPRGSGD